MSYRHHDSDFYKDFVQGIIAASTYCQTDEQTLPRRYLTAFKTISSNNIIMLSTSKGDVMDSSVNNQKLMDLLENNSTYEQISPQTILKNAMVLISLTRNYSQKKTNFGLLWLITTPPTLKFTVFLKPTNLIFPSTNHLWHRICSQ